MKHNVANIATVISDPKEILERANNEFNIFDPEACQDPKVAQDIEAIITSSHDGVPDWAWTAPKLKIIACYGVGYDGIDAVKAEEKGIWVTNTSGVLNNAVADLALALMLSVTREVVKADRYARDGKWLCEGHYPLVEGLMNKRLGMLGMGGIGQEIASRASAFKLNISYTCRSPKDVSYDYVASLKELAEQSDILCSIVPGGPETQNLINVDILKALGPEGYLVNISRGSVVDEQALVEALTNKTIKGAALDVYAAEPNIPPELFKLDNVVLLPHIGSATVNTRNEMGYLMLENVAKILAGESAITPVNSPKS